jgi:DNA polymerase IV
MLVSSYPQAILHIDGDAFFASVEQATQLHLKGKPVITGAERGVVIAASYEAKACGVERGMQVHEAKKVCPELIVVPSNYETYTLFSKRMFDIIRRFTPQVEEYSIDEAFADISGLRRLYRCSYAEIAQKIKTAIESELGITVSIGLSSTKSLAKLGSKFDKPSGLITIPGRDLEDFLAKNTIDKVWGFGRNSVALLHKQGIYTILDFIKRPHRLAVKLFGKIGSELWHELSGTSVYPVDSVEKTTYASISKFKTFSPSSQDAEYVFARLLRNLEKAIHRMRRFKLATKRIIVTLRTHAFRDHSLEITLSRATNAILDLVKPVKEHFDKLFEPGMRYRSTGIVLCDLKDESPSQLTIFEDPVHLVKTQDLSVALDDINHRYGMGQVHLASSLPADKEMGGKRNKLHPRDEKKLKGEPGRRHLGMPVMHL